MTNQEIADTIRLAAVAKEENAAAVVHSANQIMIGIAKEALEKKNIIISELVDAVIALMVQTRRISGLGPESALCLGQLALAKARGE